MKFDIYAPESLSDITLEQYMKFYKIQDGQEESNFIHQKMVEIFCNLDLKDVATIKYKSLKKVLMHLNDIFQEKPKFKNRFELNGIHYGFIPKLDEMSFGEYIDLDSYLTDWNSMDKAMSILYRPIKHKHGDKYLIEEYKGINSDLRQMPLSIVMGCIVFFYHLSKDLLINTLKYLKVSETNIHSNQTLVGNGVGINLSMQSVKETLQDLIKLPNLEFTNV